MYMDKINVYGGKTGNRKLHLINMEKLKDGHFIKNFKLLFQYKWRQKNMKWSVLMN